MLFKHTFCPVPKLSGLFYLVVDPPEVVGDPARHTGAVLTQRALHSLTLCVD